MLKSGEDRLKPLPPHYYTTSVHLLDVKSFLEAEAYEQSYLIEELQSLGFLLNEVNELNANGELLNLIKDIKESLLQQYDQCYKEQSSR
jgi:hypothetical protein